MEYLTPRVNYSCPICGADFKSGIMPGQRFIVNNPVFYECGAEIKVKERNPNSFHLVIDNCFNNKLKSYKTCEVNFKKIKSKKLFEEKTLFIRSEGNLNSGYYYVLENYYLDMSEEWCGIENKWVCVCFTDLERANKYCAFVKSNWTGWEHLKPKRMSLKKIKQNFFLRKMAVDPGISKKCDCIVRKKTKIVKICST